MSLGVVVKGSSGLAFAADTRVTLAVRRKGDAQVNVVAFDNASKLLSLGEPHKWFAAVTYGEALIGNRTAHSYLPEFELEIGDERLQVAQYAERLSDFFQTRWSAAAAPGGGDGINFIVAGYDVDAPYGSTFLFNIPKQPQPEPRNAEGFGMTWGGQIEIVNRIVQGYDPGLAPAFASVLQSKFGLSKADVQQALQSVASQFQHTIPYDVLPLQDCVDLAAFLVRTTMTAQSLAVVSRGVGGSIEVAAMTRQQGLQWVQRQELRGDMKDQTTTAGTSNRLSEGTLRRGSVAGQKEGVSPPTAFDAHEVVHDEGHREDRLDDISLARQLSDDYRRIGIAGTTSYNEFRARRARGS